MKKQDEAKELQVHANQVPIAVAGQRMGFDGADDGDLLMPRLKVVQPIEAVNFDSVNEPNIKPGVFINSITHEILGNEFIPIFVMKSWIKFKPQSEGGGMEWRSTDANDPRVIAESKWGIDDRGNDVPPLAASYLNFFSVMEGSESPLMISFTKTSYKAGKKLLSLAKLRPGDLFSRKYRLTARLSQNDLKQSYFVLDVSPGPAVTNEEHQRCLEMFKSFHPRKETIVTDQETAPEEGGF